MNLYELPTPNPAPKPTRHWGLGKSYEIVRVRSYKFVRISHLVKYVRIGREIALAQQFPALIINQYIRMISEGSCDTVDWSNDAENSALKSQ